MSDASATGPAPDDRAGAGDQARAAASDQAGADHQAGAARSARDDQAGAAAPDDQAGAAAPDDLAAAAGAARPDGRPTPPVQVGLVGPESWQVWRDIRLRALADSPEAFGSTYRRELAFTERDWTGRLDGAGPAVLARSGTVPVGMGAGYQDRPGWLHVVAMWVDPAWRGQRVGTLVLDEVVRWARARGLRTHLDVAVANPAARRVYERYGFVSTGRTAPLRPGSELRVERMELPG